MRVKGCHDEVDAVQREGKVRDEFRTGDEEQEEYHSVGTRLSADWSHLLAKTRSSGIPPGT